MSKMSSVQKGDIFENEVFTYFKTEIEEDRFYSKKEYCAIYQKKRLLFA